MTRTLRKSIVFIEKMHLIALKLLLLKILSHEIFLFDLLHKSFLKALLQHQARVI